MRWHEFDLSLIQGVNGDKYDAIAIGNEIRRITVTPGMNTMQFINALTSECNKQPPGWCKSMLNAMTAIWITKIFKPDAAPVNLHEELSTIAANHWANFIDEIDALPSPVSSPACMSEI
jgi:hypothetical protein